VTPPETSSTEALLGRVGRRAIAFAAVATAVAGILPWGGAWTAAAVTGGAAMSLVSFWAIRRGVTGLADAVIARPDVPPAKAGGPRFLALFVLRYALLAGMAYVMIARLRLSPLGLLCGASVTMLAAAAELTRRFRPS
jgi:hypothetical protein